MWESNTMSFSQSLATTALGMFVVMLVLITLALAIIIVTKILNSIGLGSEKKVEQPAIQNVSKVDGLDEESYAVIMAAICEEIHQPLDKFRIIEIKEVN